MSSDAQSVHVELLLASSSRLLTNQLPGAFTCIFCCEGGCTDAVRAHAGARHFDCQQQGQVIACACGSCSSLPLYCEGQQSPHLYGLWPVDQSELPPSFPWSLSIELSSKLQQGSGWLLVLDSIDRLPIIWWETCPRVAWLVNCSSPMSWSLDSLHRQAPPKYLTLPDLVISWRGSIFCLMYDCLDRDIRLPRGPLHRKRAKEASLVCPVIHLCKNQRLGRGFQLLKPTWSSFLTASFQYAPCKANSA